MPLELGYCYTASVRPIKDVIGATPLGKIAMFRVIAVPPTVSDRRLGLHVYVKNGKIFDFMCDHEIEGLEPEHLLFISYIHR